MMKSTDEPQKPNGSSGYKYSTDTGPHGAGWTGYKSAGNVHWVNTPDRSTGLHEAGSTSSGASQDISIFEQRESKVRSYARAFPTIFDHACGAELWDVTGRRYLDFLSGAGSLNYGHNNPILKAALLDYLEHDSITHGLDYHTVAKARFLEAMQDIVLHPRGLDYVIQFTGPTGTNAVEAAFKIARKVTGRTNIICFTNGFHGVSMGALSATCNKYFREVAGLPLTGTTVMPFDGYLGDNIDTIDYLERMITDPASGVDFPAAVIVEAVQGEGGLNVAKFEWLRRLEALCRNNGILLILDDIQAGCGRTGTFFSFEPAGIKPDIITLSKSLSGYGLPFAVTLIEPSHDVWNPGEHNGTFRGNNHAFVTAAAALEHFWTTDDLAEEVQAKGKHLGRRLQAMADSYNPLVDQVRGRGMMQGLRCSDPACAAGVAKKAFENGLIIERSGSHDEIIKCMMPLTITFDQLDEGLDILELALFEAFGSIAHAAVSREHHGAAE